MAPQRTPIEKLFWPKVDKTPGHGPRGTCWLWIGQHGPRGYGQFSNRQGYSAYAHRAAWELARGKIPAGLKVLHKCDTPLCVRPSHLFVGTQADNMADMQKKGRAHRVGRKGTANHRARLTDEQVREIRRRAASGEAQNKLAEEFPCGHATINRIVLRKSWKHLG